MLPVKIIAIGDTHGCDLWEQICESEQFDILLFLGDYFDSHTARNPQKQIRNFKRILDYKSQNPAKVVLLIGNHDYQYLPGINERYSGYQHFEAPKFSKILNEALQKDLLQVVYKSGNYLFSHAGLTKTWCANHPIDPDNIEDSVNSLFQKDKGAFSFDSGFIDSVFGDDLTQSPLWVRPNSLLADKPDGFIQIVGHTVKERIEMKQQVVFIDTLTTSREFLVLDNGELSSGRYGINGIITDKLK